MQDNLPIDELPFPLLRNLVVELSAALMFNRHETIERFDMLRELRRAQQRFQ
jgi:hypothetical protein